MFGVRPNLDAARESHEYLVELISHFTDIGDVVDQGFAGERWGLRTGKLDPYFVKRRRIRQLGTITVIKICRLCNLAFEVRG